MTDKPKPQKYEDLLMQAFEFDETALEANASGRLTPDQRRRAFQNVSKRQWVFGFFTFALGVVVMGYFARLWSNPTAILVISVILGFVFMIGLFSWGQNIAELRRGRVESVEGRIQLDFTRRGKKFLMQIGDELFEIDKARFLALKNGDPYRVYYLPRTGFITSLEWLLSDAARNPFLEDAAEKETLVEPQDSPTMRSRR